MDVIALHGGRVYGRRGAAGNRAHRASDRRGLAARARSRPVFRRRQRRTPRADRAIEQFLPLVNAQRTLRFITLPEGDDPDSLVQKLGRAGFAHFLQTARPLSQFLWELATLNKSFTRPERLIRSRANPEAAASFVHRGPWGAKFYVQFVNDQLVGHSGSASAARRAAQGRRASPALGRAERARVRDIRPQARTICSW